MVASFLGWDSGGGIAGSIDRTLAREIGLIAAVFVLSAAEGVLLAARFRVLALLPFVVINAAIIVLIWAAAHAHNVPLLIELVLVSALAVQLGYLAGQVGIRRLRAR